MNRKLLQNILSLPNLFTIIRLFSVPILWVLVMKGYHFAFGIGIILALLTDAIDGFLARRLNLVTDFGSKLDSLADLLLTISIFAWLIIFETGFFQENAVILLVVIFIGIVNLMTGLVKFKQLGNLHLYSSKVAGFLAFIFLSHTFLVDGYNQPMFNIVISIYILSLLEGLVLQLTQNNVDEHMGSILIVYKRIKDRKT